jgi:hypothetical protein
MKDKDRVNSGMTRQSFLKATALLPLTAFGTGQATATPPRDVVPGSRVTPRLFKISNAHFQLNLTAGQGLRTEMVHAPSGLTLASGDYSFSFGQPVFSATPPTREGNTSLVNLVGDAGNGIEVRQQYRAPKDQPWVEEEITLTNKSHHPIALPDARCGFVLPAKVTGDSVESPLKDFKFIAVPYRREPTGNRSQYADYTLLQVLTEPRHSELRAQSRIQRFGRVVLSEVYAMGIIKTDYQQYASEGWVFTDGRRGFLVSKYSQEGMEWALFDRIPLGDERLGLRWGGFGVFQGDPESAALLAPQATHRFGVTRITAFEGGINEGFYAFRAEMDARGMGCPQGFNPPVHWNELYDNKLWWLPDSGMDNPENRKKYYTLDDLKEGANSAREMGCEALYLDPGWDTLFASKIWDEPRLGKLQDFTAMLRRDYSLKLSLHTPLSGWCDPSSYSRDLDRMNRDGSRVEMSLCGASRQYVDESLSRLSALAQSGAAFFMFDGTMTNGECWDPHHGHPVPSRRHDHVDSTNRLAFLVHARYPDVLIEMHDQIVGGSNLRYVPTYYGYGKRQLEAVSGDTHGFDTVWGFELMWSPMTDLVGGHSMALYYYNLAYSLPLYLHIDLRTDNPQCLMFWWNASTCRHLGIGGTHIDPVVRKAQKDAMAAYRRLEPFFKVGKFYGLDETVHVHVHPSQPAAVMNVFNLENQPATRHIEFTPSQIGLESSKEYQVIGATATRRGDLYLLDVVVPALGHSLVELR